MHRCVRWQGQWFLAIRLILAATERGHSSGNSCRAIYMSRRSTTAITIAKMVGGYVIRELSATSCTKTESVRLSVRAVIKCPLRSDRGQETEPLEAAYANVTVTRRLAFRLKRQECYWR